MASDAARRHAASLLSHWPGAFIAEAHLVAIAEDLEHAGLDIADDVIALLRLRCRSVPSGPDIHETAREVRRETMSPRMDLGYKDSGHRPMTADEWAHGAFHLDALLATPAEDRTDEQRELSRNPQRCDCTGRRRRGLAGVALTPERRET